MKQVIGAAFGGGLGIATFFAYNAGFFKEVKVEEKKIAQKKIVYFEHEGDYQELGPVFRKLIKDSQPYLKVKNVYRIKYDDPYTIQDLKKSRSVIGLEVDNPVDENGAKMLLKDKKDYKLAILPETDSINTTFEMTQKNFNIAFFIIKFKLYPAIDGYIAKKISKDKTFKLKDENRLVEIFKFDERKNPYEIEFNVPFGEASAKYNLHSKSLPKYQDVK